MRIIKKIVPGIFFIIGSFGVNAQTDSVYSFTLSQAQEFAVKNNLNAKNAQLDIESAHKKVWETTAIGLPQFSTTANYQHNFKYLFLCGGLTINCSLIWTNGDGVNTNSSLRQHNF